MLGINPEERHHSPIKQISDFTLHLHIDVLNQHAVDYGKSLKVESMFHQLVIVFLDIVNLSLELNVIICLVSCSLSLETANTLLDVSLH